MRTPEELVEAAKDAIDKVAALDDPLEAIEEVEEYLEDIAHVCRAVHEAHEEPKEYQP
jgi:hypothetical protein